jgi:O-antigen/teichoic acid export membrane protein
MKNEGVNVVINLFAGTAINTARGIAMQVNGIVMQFISNFTMALNPQIIKDYASGQLERMHKLMFQGTKLSYYIFMILSIPIIFEIEPFLQVWLGKVPAHTVLFTRLVMVLSLAEIVSHTLITAQTATGKIKVYQVVVGGILLLNLPISYLLLRWGCFPEVTVVVAIIVSQLCLVARLCFLRKMIDLPVMEFVKKVYCNVIVVTVISLIVPAVCYLLISPGIVRFFVLCSLSVLSSIATIYFVGCNHDDRAMVVKMVEGVISKLRRR